MSNVGPDIKIKQWHPIQIKSIQEFPVITETEETNKDCQM